MKFRVPLETRDGREPVTTHGRSPLPTFSFAIESGKPARTGFQAFSKHPARDVSHEGAGECGQALIELALTLPILMIVMGGLLAFGVAMNNYVMVTDATNVAGRQLAISRGTTTDPCAQIAAVVYNAAPILKQSSFSMTFTLNGVQYTGSTCDSGDLTKGAPSNLVQGKTATLKVTYPCSIVIYGVNTVPGCTLPAQTTESVQ